MSKLAGFRKMASGEAEAAEDSLERKESLGFRGGIGGGVAFQQLASVLLGGCDEVEEAETS